MSARTGGSPPHTPEGGRPARAAPPLPGARAGAAIGATTGAPAAGPSRVGDAPGRIPSLTADAAPVAYPPAYADIFALIPALRDRPCAHGERLDALAQLSTRAELGAISAPEPYGRAAHHLVAETARALHRLLTEGAEPAGFDGRDPRPAPDSGSRLGLAARVARLAGWLGARLPADGHVAPAHALCAEVHASLL